MQLFRILLRLRIQEPQPLVTSLCLIGFERTLTTRILAFLIHQCMFLEQTIYNKEKQSVFQPVERTGSKIRVVFYRACWKEAGLEGSLLASFHRFWDAISGRVAIVCMLCRRSLQALTRLTDILVQPVTVARGMISLST